VLFEPGETLTAIDVDSAGAGGRKGRAPRRPVEVNLEAAPAIAQQLRLRNIAGAVVIDFVTMRSAYDRDKVQAALADALRDDPVPAQVYGFTRLGLFELTRARRGATLAVQLEALEDCAGGCFRQTPPRAAPDARVGSGRMSVPSGGHPVAELYRAVPAAAGEQYTLARFGTGSMGFASGHNCDTAVCVPADAHLRLEGIGTALQTALGVGPVEDVVMRRLETGLHKDAVRFASGKTISLQSLNPGVKAVMFVPAEEEIDIRGSEPARRVRELVDA
jgi:hypothetical protein